MYVYALSMNMGESASPTAASSASSTTYSQKLVAKLLASPSSAPAVPATTAAVLRPNLHKPQTINNALVVKISNSSIVTRVQN